MSRQKTPVDYKFLHQFSTASELEVLSARLKRKNKSDVFQAEEILAEKKVSCFLF